MATRTYTKKNTVSTEGMQVAEAPDFTIPAHGTVTRADVPDIQVVADTVESISDWAQEMDFLNAPIEIRIQGTTNPNDEQRVFVCVNGEMSHPKYGNYLPRDVEITVKRKVVEGLARAKPISITTPQVKDIDGSDTARIMQRVGNQYPFELVNPTKQDVEWVKRIRAQV